MLLFCSFRSCRGKWNVEWKLSDQKNSHHPIERRRAHYALGQSSQLSNDPSGGSLSGSVRHEGGGWTVPHLPVDFLGELGLHSRLQAQQRLHPRSGINSLCTRCDD
jgi:hypothetical protein